jgi:uncharacterized membrane protein YfcA
MPVLTPLHYCLLFATGLIAGTVDAIAGGGGLIMLPVLLGLGLPAPLALGTNKLGAAFGTGSAAWSYARRGAVAVRECVPGIVAALVGSLAGSFIVHWINSDFLTRVIPWLLAAVIAYLVFRPKLGESSRHRRMRPFLFYLLFGLVLGFYDGFFGPGVGSFWMVAFVAVLGLDFLHSAAHARVMNFASNVAALAVFSIAGTVLLIPGLVLGAGQLIGGRLGAYLALTRGVKFVRPIFLVMAGLTVLKLLYQLSLRP